MKKLSKEQKTKIVQSLKENRKRPYKNENVDYVYGVFIPEIIVLPLGIVWDLLDAWDKVKKSYDEDLSYSEAIKLFEYYWELEIYCEGMISDGYGDEPFFLPSTYSIDTNFCNTNNLMDENLPNDIFDTDFMEESYTGYGDDLIIIDEKYEKPFLEFFNSKKQKIIRDDELMNDTIMPGWFFSDYC